MSSRCTRLLCCHNYHVCVAPGTLSSTHLPQTTIAAACDVMPRRTYLDHDCFCTQVSWSRRQGSRRPLSTPTSPFVHCLSCIVTDRTAEDANGESHHQPRTSSTTIEDKTQNGNLEDACNGRSKLRSPEFVVQGLTSEPAKQS